MQCGNCLFDSQWNGFGDEVSPLSIPQAFSAMWRSFSGPSKYHDRLTVSIIFPKPGLMADIVLILSSPSFSSLWLIPMSMLPYSPNCWSQSWGLRNLVPHFTPWPPMIVHTANGMTRSRHGKWFLNAGHLITEVTVVDCSSVGME